MAKLTLRRTLNGWAPADADSQEAAKRFTVGECYRASIVRPRSLKSLARYWVLVDIIYHNTDQFGSKDEVHDYLKLRAGHCSLIASKSTGEIFKVPKSIDFDSLEESDWQAVYRRITDAVLEDILPGINENELQYEIEKLCGVAA